MRKFWKDESGFALLGIAFVLAFGAALGSTATVVEPKVYNWTNKHIVQADHNAPLPYEEKDNAHKR